MCLYESCILRQFWIDVHSQVGNVEIVIDRVFLHSQSKQAFWGCHQKQQQHDNIVVVPPSSHYAVLVVSG